jgi:hypothetical protein
LSRPILALKSFFGLLFSGQIPDDVLQKLGLSRRAPGPAKAAPAPAKPVVEGPTPQDGAVQILSLLQREARLVDFLMEEIGPFTDDQVGAVVRDIHKNSRETLARHVTVSPVVDGVEGTMTTLASVGLDAKDTTRLRLIGKVPSEGGVKAGILRHRGWKVDKIELPTLPAGKKLLVIAPAEVEVE